MLHHLTKITLRIFDNVYVTLFTVQHLTNLRYLFLTKLSYVTTYLLRV